jgi:hypothetical protein
MKISKYNIIIEEQSPTKAKGLINGKFWSARIVLTTMGLGPCKWSYRPDTLSRGERIAIGKQIAKNDK